MDTRKCTNCWWSNGGNNCLFLEELKMLEEKPSHGMCWGWRPNEKKEKMNYLEKYGHEVDRIGKLPILN